jgi:hypothetical protein
VSVCRVLLLTLYLHLHPAQVFVELPKKSMNWLSQVTADAAPAGGERSTPSHHNLTNDDGMQGKMQEFEEVELQQEQNERQLWEVAEIYWHRWNQQQQWIHAGGYFKNPITKGGEEGKEGGEEEEVEVVMVVVEENDTSDLLLKPSATLPLEARQEDGEEAGEEVGESRQWFCQQEQDDEQESPSSKYKSPPPRPTIVPPLALHAPLALPLPLSRTPRSPRAPDILHHFLRDQLDSAIIQVNPSL